MRIKQGVMLLCLLLLASTGMAQERQWKLITDRDGIQVFRAHNDDSRIKTFRGEADINLQDFRSIGPIMDDYDFVADWLHMVSAIKGVSRRSASDRTVWVSTQLPWPVSDRDAFLSVQLSQDPDSYVVRLPFHNIDGQPEKDGFVRIPRMRGFFEFRPLAPGRLHVTFQVILDPGGYMPAWLANLILRDIPYFSLKRLRQVANTERYQGVDLGYYRIPPGWPGADDQQVSHMQQK